MNNSKIHKDEVDWLIAIACSSDISELKYEAIEKLKEYGLTQEQIEERYRNLDSNEAQKKAFENAMKKKHERNEFETYTTKERMKIFFFGPFELFKYFNSGLRELHEFNYKIKFRERLLLLIAGTIFWTLTVIFVFKYSEYQRQKEIDNLDISDRERNRIN
ncbi:MAG: hypothetical protein HOO86_01595 [Bacteroidales bacterium]|nr:hypothetical protein [Bacteroidales bacterium]